MLAIGQAARLAGVTPKALRHYDRIGLLRPAVVDAATGYRRYDPEQVAQARLIRRLRALELPLDEIRRLLDLAPDKAAFTAALATHRRRIEARVTRLRGILHTLDHASNDDDWITMGEPDDKPPADERERHFYWGRTLFNDTWRLMEKEDRTPEEDDQMVHQAHASAYHWLQVGTPANFARSHWQCSRVYCVLGRARTRALPRPAGAGDLPAAQHRRLGPGVRIRGARSGAFGGRQPGGGPALGRAGQDPQRRDRRGRGPGGAAERPGDRGALSGGLGYAYSRFSYSGP